MSHKRLIILEIILFIFSAVLTGRLFYWQILKHEDFVVVAKTQIENTVFVGAKRGKILATDGSVLVANQKAYLMYALLPDISESKKESKKNEEDFYQDLATKLAIPLFREKIAKVEKISQAEKDEIRDGIRDGIIAQLQQKGLIWVPLARKISESTRGEIKKLSIEGIGFEEDTKRFYPENDLAPSLLGFIGKDNQGNDKGYFGLEGFFDSKLRGRSGTLIQEVDAFGRPILAASPEGLGAQDGSDLLTTIDKTVQFTIDRKLKEGIKRYGAKSGAVIVLEPKTGSLLASSSFPTYSLDDPTNSKPQYYKNLGISAVFEPGSTFKSITFASALDSGSIKTDTICPCKGPIKSGGYEVQTFDNKYYPNSTITDILQRSDNIGAAFAAQKMGTDTFLKYINDFGLGVASGIGLQGEENGIIKNKADWHEIDLINAGFGQGVSVTPLQLVNSLAAIANDGVLMKPFVVKKIINDRNEIEFGPKKVRRVIKSSTATVMKQLLLAAVEGGEAKNLIPKGYRVGGKTGTAQIPIPGGYSTKTVASFIGFGPVEEPKFAMIVVLFEPSASIFAAETAEPLFFEMIEELYPYWGIPID